MHACINIECILVCLPIAWDFEPTHWKCVPISPTRVYLTFYIFVCSIGSLCLCRHVVLIYTRIQIFVQ